MRYRCCTFLTFLVRFVNLTIVRHLIPMRLFSAIVFVSSSFADEIIGSDSITTTDAPITTVRVPCFGEACTTRPVTIVPTTRAPCFGQNCSTRPGTPKPDSGHCGSSGCTTLPSTAPLRTTIRGTPVPMTSAPCFGQDCSTRPATTKPDTGHCACGASGCTTTASATTEPTTVPMRVIDQWPVFERQTTTTPGPVPCRLWGCYI
jgi:hypothetical protein